MLKSKLKLIVMYLLFKEPSNCYTISKNSKPIYGKLPSSGTIYPLLENLFEQGHVKFKVKGNSKIYSLTVKGQLHYKSLIKSEKQDYKLTLKLYEKIGIVKK